MTPETDAVAVAREAMWRELAHWGDGYQHNAEADSVIDALIAAAHAAGAEEALARCVMCGLGPLAAHNTFTSDGITSSIATHPYLPLNALKEQHEATERVVEAACKWFDDHDHAALNKAVEEYENEVERWLSSK